MRLLTLLPRVFLGGLVLFAIGVMLYGVLCRYVLLPVTDWLDPELAPLPAAIAVTVPLASSVAIPRRRNVFVIISLLSTITRNDRNAT